MQDEWGEELLGIEGPWLDARAEAPEMCVFVASAAGQVCCKMPTLSMTLSASPPIPSILSLRISHTCTVFADGGGNREPKPGKPKPCVQGRRRFTEYHQNGANFAYCTPNNNLFFWRGKNDPI